MKTDYENEFYRILNYYKGVNKNKLKRIYFSLFMPNNEFKKLNKTDRIILGARSEALRSLINK